jgi:hypothetical protein
MELATTFLVAVAALSVVIGASVPPCELPLNCGEFNNSKVCGHTFSGCDVCDTCCHLWLKPIGLCDGCVQDECTSGRHLDCCVSFDCDATNGQCKRAYRSTGAYQNLSSCERACKPPPLRYDCDVLNYQCREVGSKGIFPSMATCTAKCGIRCPPWSQLFDGYCYAVMDQHNKTDHGNPTSMFGNQTNWTALPPGWEIAPHVSGLGPAMYSQLGKGRYAWGTDYLVYSTPCGSANSFSSTWNANEISCHTTCGYFQLITSVSDNGTHLYKTAATSNPSRWHSKAVMRIPSIGSGLGSQ